MRDYVDTARPFSIRTRDPSGSAQTISSNTVTALSTNLQESSDLQGAITTTGTADTIQRAGLYQLGAGVRFDGNDTGRRTVWVWASRGGFLASNSIESPSSAAVDLSCSRPVYLQVGDTVETRVFQSSGGNLAAQASARCYRSVVFLRG